MHKESYSCPSRNNGSSPSSKVLDRLLTLFLSGPGRHLRAEVSLSLLREAGSPLHPREAGSPLHPREAGYPPTPWYMPPYYTLAYATPIPLWVYPVHTLPYCTRCRTDRLHRRGQKGPWTQGGERAWVRASFSSQKCKSVKSVILFCAESLSASHPET